MTDDHRKTSKIYIYSDLQIPGGDVRGEGREDGALRGRVHLCSARPVMELTHQTGPSLYKMIPVDMEKLLLTLKYEVLVINWAEGKIQG